MAKFSGSTDKIYVTHINIRQSIFFLLLKLIFLDILAAVISILFFYLVSSKNIPVDFSNTLLSYNLSFFLTLIAIKIILSIYIIMEWLNEYYEIWPNLILHKSGFIFKNEDRHPLSHIRSIKIEQGFFGKIFGFGTITIYDWYLEKYTSLYLIHNPVKYYDIIDSLISRTEKERQIFQDYTES